MVDGAALSKALSGLSSHEPVAAGSARAAVLSASLTHRIEEIEPLWRSLEADGVESPGQSYGFIRLWTLTQKIAPADQHYVVGFVGGQPVALLPLRRRRSRGMRIFSWFPGAHVGCNAPLVDAGRLAQLSPDERRALWRTMLAQLRGADLVFLKSVPEAGVFAELGTSLATETLYRAQFDSFEQCSATQRSKSRRKHDRQQGDRLNALGDVTFEALSNGPEAEAVLGTMFRQRAARFVQMGVVDPFAPECVRRFYDASVRADSDVPVMLHVLRLDGEVVAVRYNVVHGDRLFCLISSMSDDPAIQIGSPGKQCLLRVMQTVFDGGFTTFDMGEGFTDEKRHWCNVQTPVRQHYLPLNHRGAGAAAAHRLWQSTRARVKSDPRLMAVAKGYRQALMKLKGGQSGAAPDEPASD